LALNQFVISFSTSSHFLVSTEKSPNHSHAEAFIGAMAELDVLTSGDDASGDSVGGYFATHTQDPSNATRSTARTAYYNPFVSRPSLHLLTSRQVTRVITQSTYHGPKVTGVEVTIIFPSMVTSLSK
jgi:choline dehydrogenase